MFKNNKIILWISKKRDINDIKMKNYDDNKIFKNKLISSEESINLLPSN